MDLDVVSILSHKQTQLAPFNIKEINKKVNVKTNQILPFGTCEKTEAKHGSESIRRHNIKENTTPDSAHTSILRASLQSSSTDPFLPHFYISAIKIIKMFEIKGLNF